MTSSLVPVSVLEQASRSPEVSKYVSNSSALSCTVNCKKTVKINDRSPHGWCRQIFKMI